MKDATVKILDKLKPAARKGQSQKGNNTKMKKDTKSKKAQKQDKT